MRHRYTGGGATAVGCLLLVAGFAHSAYAQPVNHEGWEWEGRERTARDVRLYEPAGPSDEWLSRDKALHAGASFLLTLSSQYVLEAKADLSQGEALPLSMATALSAGVLKEVLDSRRLRAPRFSYQDLVANAVGILLAAGLIAL